MAMSQLKIMPIVSCFLRLTSLFLFITLEVSVKSRLKNAQLTAQRAPSMGFCSVISVFPHKTVHRFQNCLQSPPPTLYKVVCGVRVRVWPV